MKENQNGNNSEEYPSRRKKNSFCRRRTIVFICLAIIAGLGLIAAVILISIEFHQLHRLSHDASAFTLRTSNAMNSSTTTYTTFTTSTHVSSTTVPSTTTPTTMVTVTPSTTSLTTILRIVSMNTTTPMTIKNFMGY